MIKLIQRKKPKTVDFETSIRQRQRRQKIDRYLALRGYRTLAQKALEGLHPTVVLSHNYRYSELPFAQHQVLKCSQDPDYCCKIPVLFVISRSLVVVEIDSWQIEAQYDCLNVYGLTQLRNLIGDSAFKAIETQRLLFPETHPSFFGNYFFPIHHYEAAIRLANFSARRDQFPDFKNWFARTAGYQRG